MTLARLRAALRPRLRRPRPTPVILMYHRVADVRVDPWELAVRPDHFAAQMEVLRATRTPLPMSEFVGRAKRGALPANAVAVTFDDGYVDTLREARPRLSAAGIPASLFLVTSFVGQRVEYWWDELARAVLERDSPLAVDVQLAGQTQRLALSGVADAAAESAGWKGLDAPVTARQALFRRLWEHVRLTSPAECEEAMRALRMALGHGPARREDLPMNASEVADLASDPLFEVGGHTSTHPVLPALAPAARRHDIAEGRRACEALIHGPASGFAYPHGAHDADSRAAVAECGFAWACTTQWRPLGNAFDVYALPRLQVLDWAAEPFERALEETWA